MKKLLLALVLVVLLVPLVLALLPAECEAGSRCPLRRSRIVYPTYGQRYCLCEYSCTDAHGLPGKSCGRRGRLTRTTNWFWGERVRCVCARRAWCP